MASNTSGSRSLPSPPHHPVTGCPICLKALKLDRVRMTSGHCCPGRNLFGSFSHIQTSPSNMSFGLQRLQVASDLLLHLLLLCSGRAVESGDVASWRAVPSPKICKARVFSCCNKPAPRAAVCGVTHSVLAEPGDTGLAVTQPWDQQARGWERAAGALEGIPRPPPSAQSPSLLPSPLKWALGLLTS